MAVILNREHKFDHISKFDLIWFSGLRKRKKNISNYSLSYSCSLKLTVNKNKKCQIFSSVYIGHLRLKIRLIVKQLIAMQFDPILITCDRFSGVCVTHLVSFLCCVFVFCLSSSYVL